jgi:hypothetical protein
VTGVADLLAGNATVDSPSTFENDRAVFSQDSQHTNVWLFADGVPEPAWLAVHSVAGVLLAGLRRRRD